MEKGDECFLAGCDVDVSALRLVVGSCICAQAALARPAL